MDEKKLKQAQKVYEMLCTAMEEIASSERNPEKLSVSYRATGDDLPISLRCYVQPEQEVVMIYSTLPLKFKEEDRRAAVLASIYLNDQLVNGSFDLDLSDGTMCYRLCQSYRDSLLSPKLFEHIVQYATYAVEKYNDKLFMLAKGMVEFDAFIHSLD